jgi:hypothetical protein
VLCSSVPLQVPVLGLMSLCSTLVAQARWAVSPSMGDLPVVTHQRAAYDMQRQCTVVFGGYDSSWMLVDGVFEFDGHAWQERSSQLQPPSRTRYSLTFDPYRNVTVLFGGSRSTSGHGSLNDTWEWNGSSWTPRITANAPSPRIEHAAVFDMAWGHIVMFGGYDAGLRNPTYGDTWIYDGADWTQVQTYGPSPRHGHAMAYSYHEGRTVLFGGMNYYLFDDTWTWDGRHWQLQQTTTKPTPRAGHGMAYDVRRGRCVVHGGQPGGSSTWEWDGADWTEATQTTPPRVGHSLVYDARLQQVLMLGGTDAAMSSFADSLETYGEAIPGSLTSQGQGCAGSLGVPQLVVPAGTQGPEVGSSTRLQVLNAAGWVMANFGVSNTVDRGQLLPVDLSLIGMPGCTQQVSLDAVVGIAPSAGVASVKLVVPAVPLLLNAHFYVQAFVLDPTANSGGMVTTNHMVATVGRS